MSVPAYIKDLILSKTGADKALVFESERVLVHAEGRFPEYLFATRFPTEPEETFAYRKATYVPNTQAAYSKIENALSRILSEGNLIVTWPEISERLQHYVDHEYINDGSLYNWLFTFGIRALLTEPNGVILVEPSSYEWSGRYCSPVVRVIPASRVIHRTEYDLLYKDVNDEYIYMDTNDIVRLTTVPSKNSTKLVSQVLLRHNFGILPGFLVGGDPIDYNGHGFKSVISACVPHWDTAVLDNSVLRAAVHGHVYPEYQLLEADECNTCGGTGKLKALDRQNGTIQVPCHTCFGTGKAPHSPGFGNYHIKMERNNPFSSDTQFPQQPVKQYINKDFSSIPVLQEQIERSIRMAYSAVHLEFLAESPAAQSGIAKAYDREYTNAFLAKISKLLYDRIFTKILRIMAHYFYVLPFQLEEREDANVNEYLPVLEYPTTFDIYSQDTALQQLQLARQVGAPSQVIESLTDSLVTQTLFGNYEDHAEYKVLKTIDPLFSYTLQDKLALLQNGGCSRIDFVISVNLPSWIKAAARTESKNGVEFLRWTPEEQLEYFKNKAYEVEKSNGIRS